jgi:hypothetical protein
MINSVIKNVQETIENQDMDIIRLKDDIRYFQNELSKKKKFLIKAEKDLKVWRDFIRQYKKFKRATLDIQKPKV